MTPYPPPDHSADAPAPASVLVRISEAFSGIADPVLKEFGAASIKRLGSEYYWITTTKPAAVRQSRAAIFARWNLTLDHTWPCNPSKMAGFLDKAASSMARKFAVRKPQAVLIGLLNPGSPDRWFRNLAANLRDLVCQGFPPLPVLDVEEQNPEVGTLFGLVGKEGLFCGISSPKDANGFYPGGSKFIGTRTPDAISRAGAKIAEALHYLRLHRAAPPPGSRWLELGACPGGMTSELLHRGFHVTAIDVASLDKRLDGHPGLSFVRADVKDFRPVAGTSFDAVICDMNGPPADSIRQVARLSSHLVAGGLVIFTLKLPRVETVAAPLKMLDATLDTAAAGGLRLLAKTHLTYNRHEFTLFFERPEPGRAAASRRPFRNKSAAASAPPSR